MGIEEEQVPPEWRSRAFVARNGELAWKRDDALEVLSVLVDRGLAILGGEVWAVTATGQIWGALPQEADGVGAVYHWETSPSWVPRAETWLEFCERGASVSARAIRNLPPEGEVRTDLRSILYYNLTFVTRCHYVELHPSTT